MYFVKYAYKQVDLTHITLQFILLTCDVVQWNIDKPEVHLCSWNKAPFSLRLLVLYNQPPIEPPGQLGVWLQATALSYGNRAPRCEYSSFVSLSQFWNLAIPRRNRWTMKIVEDYGRATSSLLELTLGHSCRCSNVSIGGTLHGADGTHYASCVCTVGQVSSTHCRLGFTN